MTLAQGRLSSKERKREILERSLEIIDQEGFANLTIRNLSEKIGISQAAIYRHFRDKNEIVDYLSDMVFEPVTGIKLEQDSDPRAILERLMLQQMERLEENPHLTAITFQEEIFRGYPEVKAKFDRHRQGKEELLRRVVLLGQSKGVFLDSIDPEIFPLVFMGSMRMAVLKWRYGNYRYSLVEHGRKLAEEMWKLLRGGR